MGVSSRGAALPASRTEARLVQRSALRSRRWLRASVAGSVRAASRAVPSIAQDSCAKRPLRRREATAATTAADASASGGSHRFPRALLSRHLRRPRCAPPRTSGSDSRHLAARRQPMSLALLAFLLSCRMGAQATTPSPEVPSPQCSLLQASSVFVEVEKVPDFCKAADGSTVGFVKTTKAPSTTTFTTATTTSTTTTASHYLMALGDPGCPPGLTVVDSVECNYAIAYLAMNEKFGIEAESDDYPSGCSVNPSSACTSSFCHVFNKNTTGKGRLDLAPVCKTNVPGREGGQAFAEDILNLGVSTSREGEVVTRFTTQEYVYDWPTSTKYVETTSTTTHTTTTQTTTTADLFAPTEAPTTPPEPTNRPTYLPTPDPTMAPTAIPTAAPTFRPTMKPTPRPTPAPPPGLPCAAPCPRIPVKLCAEKLAAGGACQSSTWGTPCIVQRILTFTCPVGNKDPDRPVNVTEDLHLGTVRCWVCSLQVGSTQETDPRKGKVSVEISWGPNMEEGVLSEVGIAGYSVFIADFDGARIPGLASVLYIKAKGITWDDASKQCCERTTYKGRMTFDMPEGHTQVRLEVVPVPQDGDLEPDHSFAMPAGRLTEPIADWSDKAFLLASTSAATASGRSLGAPLVCVLAVFAAVAVALLPGGNAR